ncbi:MAG: sigma-70 family RNA polymerase sigma factor [Verrucomicrobiales bacterium]|nr:sigma-70 family RNA polymerase sigma factor [Verrucomicrobiales bacterium]
MVAPTSQSPTFPDTCWTLIHRCQDGTVEERDEALSVLCRMYWLPLYAFARRSGLSPEDAEDRVQSFFLDALRTDIFSRADEHRGRLRSLLCQAFRNQLRRWFRDQSAQKRGGSATHVPLLPNDAENQFQAQLADRAGTPEQLFARAWALTVLDTTLKRLETGYNDRGQQQRYKVLREYLPWNGSDGSTTAEGAESAGMTPGAFRTALNRMRKEYQQLIIEEVRSTVASDDQAEVDDELRHLFTTLGL